MTPPKRNVFAIVVPWWGLSWKCGNSATSHRLPPRRKKVVVRVVQGLRILFALSAKRTPTLAEMKPQAIGDLYEGQKIVGRVVGGVGFFWLFGINATDLRQMFALYKQKEPIFWDFLNS